MNNKVKFGLSNVHIAKLVEAEDGTISYETPFRLPGAVNLATDPEGETVKFKADNITYYTSTANQGYSGDLEVALVIEKFLTEILGRVKDTNGAIFESSDDISSRFALLFEIEGDAKKRRCVYYDCTASRPSTENKTIEESKEPQTEKMTLNMNPRITDHIVKAEIEPSETNKEAYDNFYKNVYEKVA